MLMEGLKVTGDSTNHLPLGMIAGGFPVSPSRAKRLP